MNQILLQVLSQDPLKTPGICLSFRWLLPLIPHLETTCKLFVLPFLGTWLGHIFLDMYDLWDQTLSIVYLGTFVGMIPKPNTSSKVWMDTNLFTILYYLLYFAELALLAYFGLNLEYSIGWLASITFSTTLTFLFYAILLKFGLSTLLYFKTIVSIYLLTDLGNILALGLLSPFYSCKIFLSIGLLFLIYLLLPYRHPLLFSWVSISPSQFDKNLTKLRCLFWGALSVWVDYIALTPFYILEIILASESHKRKDSVLYHLKEAWNTHKTTIWGNIKKMGNTLPAVIEIIQIITTKKEIIYKAILVPLLYPSWMESRELWHRDLRGFLRADRQ